MGCADPQQQTDSEEKSPHPDLLLLSAPTEVPNQQADTSGGKARSPVVSVLKPRLRLKRPSPSAGNYFNAEGERIFWWLLQWLDFDQKAKPSSIVTLSHQRNNRSYVTLMMRLERMGGNRRANLQASLETEPKMRKRWMHQLRSTWSCRCRPRRLHAVWWIVWQMAIRHRHWNSRF